MVTDQQVRRLFKIMSEENNQARAAAKAGMDVKTARKHLKTGKLPSRMKRKRTRRTRVDPFAEVREAVRRMLETNPGLEAKTIFGYLQREYPGKYQDGQLRTLQRIVKEWRGAEGPSKEVYFPQLHEPGRLCASDFTSMNELGVMINGLLFEHMLHHFVLTYSNWETATICFSESFESPSACLYNALWELGGVPERHRTDRLSAAVNNLNDREEFTRSYQALLNHHGLAGEKTQGYSPHENGDSEQSHNVLKNVVDQELMLRGSRDFASREEYESFLRSIMKRSNAGRRERFEEELNFLRRLPKTRLDDFKEIKARVTKFSTIRLGAVYSVPSRLIGEQVNVAVHAEKLEVRYAGVLVETLPRLKGLKKHHVQRRHVIDSLVRKPGAFRGYLDRDDLFPTSSFKTAHDILTGTMLSRADKEYLKILHLAARESESLVDDAPRGLIDREEQISFEAVREIVASGQGVKLEADVRIDDINLAEYDELLDAATTEAA